MCWGLTWHFWSSRTREHIERGFSTWWSLSGASLQTGTNPLSINTRKSGPGQRVCVCVCAGPQTQTHMQAHTLRHTHTHKDSFRSKGAKRGGEKVICSQTTKLKNDLDTLPNRKVNSAWHTRRQTYTKFLHTQRSVLDFRISWRSLFEGLIISLTHKHAVFFTWVCVLRN